MKKKKYWYKIDNAGKIFPAISKSARSNVFRLSFYLNEKIDPEILEKAVNMLLPRFETFAVEMKNGLFWNYLSVNQKPFKVEMEPAEICKYFKSAKNNGFLFKVYYLENKITLETFHAISDGTGALAFLKSITYYYYKLRGIKINHEGKILSETPYSKKESEDAFLSFYDKNKRKNLKEEHAYHFSGETFADHWNLMVKIKVNSRALIKIVKETYQATVTQFITALLAYAIIAEDVEFVNNKKPLKIFIPVNLRPYFNSSTLRNFSLYIKATYPSQKRSLTFEDILDLTKIQFIDQLDKDKLHERLSSNVGFEKNVLIRILPLVLKNIAFRIGYNILGENISTSSISNLGIVDLPEDMKDKILDIDFVNGGYGLAMTLISVKDHTNLILNTSIKDMSVMNFITSFLVKHGLDVTIDTNYQEDYDEIL
ncbi:MAG: hypothetical protein ACNA7K_03675 [Acholeplasmataceae bacterium]